MDKSEKIDRIREILRTSTLIESALQNSSSYGADIQKLMKVKNLMRKHHKLCENWCNIPPPHGKTWEEETDKVEARLRALLRTLKKPLTNNNEVSFSAHFQCDPRGWTVKISLHFRGSLEGPFQSFDVTTFFKWAI